MVMRLKHHYIKDENGQSTIEAALVLAGFLALLIGFSALWRAFEGGLFLEHALASASHHVQMVFPEVIGDVFMY